jgi:membrane protease YdiL (CAAX protease family)
LPAIFSYIRNYYRQAFRLYYFLLVLLLTGIFIWLNYGYGLEARYAADGQSKFRHFVGYYFLYFIPFASAFFLQPLFFKDHSCFKNHWFWIILFLAPAFFSARVNFDLHQALVSQLWSGDQQLFWIKCSNWVARVFVLLLPVFILWWIKDRNNQPFYGTRKMDNIKPYLLMLLIMVPLIALASTQDDFLQMYPKAKFLTQLELPSKKIHYIFFELCYGFDFISIEFFFRGFLILALIKICGPHCILPAACFYCTIHFGKPLGEAISSFWGGLLLGIISYNTRSIWGGLIVHLGIAWLMETGGWLALSLKNT